MVNRFPYCKFFVTLATVLALPATLHAQSGAVYTASNGVGGNEVSAYYRAPNGSIAFLGAYATGGRGAGGAIDPLQSQHSLLLSSDHRFLFAVNSGSGDVSVFGVGFQGRLTLIDRVSSSGGFPVSLAISGDLLYVLNSGGAGAISGFHVLTDGHLSPIFGSTHLLSAASAGGASIDFSPDGTVLAAAERLTNQIDTFPIDSNGVAGAPVLNHSHGATPFCLTFTPQGALVVAEAAGNPAGGSALSTYSVGAMGVLSTLSASIPTGFNGACWVAATSDGHFAYAANAASSEITISSVAVNGTLSVLGAARTGVGGTPLDLALSSDNRYLYALTAGTGTITAYQLQQNGGLAPLGSAKSLTAASGQNGLIAY